MSSILRRLTITATLYGESVGTDSAPMLEVVAGDVLAPNPLGQAVLMSLLTDRLAEGPDLVITDGDRGGWWGDSYAEPASDRIGSRLWILMQRGLTNQSATLAAEYAREALRWLLEDGVATSLDVEARRLSEGDRHGLAITVAVIRDPSATGADPRYDDLWDMTEDTDG
jgi:phage gp46-like protein